MIPLHLKVDGAVQSQKHMFSFSYHLCCLIPPLAPIWPLIAAMPVLLGIMACAVCLIFISRVGARMMPPLQEVRGERRRDMHTVCCV
jgi:hypothetical protein